MQSCILNILTASDRRFIEFSSGFFHSKHFVTKFSTFTKVALVRQPSVILAVKILSSLNYTFYKQTHYIRGSKCHYLY